MTLGAHQSIGLKGILLFGTQEQKRPLPPAAGDGRDGRRLRPDRAGRGQRRGGHPDARRADAATATSSTGRRSRITNGGFADVFTVFARTSPAEEGAKPRITAFIVERGVGREERPQRAQARHPRQLHDGGLLRRRAGPGRERARRAGPRLQGRDGGAEQRAPRPRQRAASGCASASSRWRSSACRSAAPSAAPSASSASSRTRSPR